MKITTMMMTAVATVVMATIGIASAPIASAYPTVGKLGSELTIVDTVGQVALSWRVSDLKPSVDTIPGYPVAGKLWEATATVKAIHGSVTPAIPQLNARAADGTNYRVLWQANTPNGISGATIAQGQQSTGKIYFDVTGPPPTTVALNNGMEDLLVWDADQNAATPAPPPPPACTTPYGTYQNPRLCTTYPPYPYGAQPYG